MGGASGRVGAGGCKGGVRRSPVVGVNSVSHVCAEHYRATHRLLEGRR